MARVNNTTNAVQLILGVVAEKPCDSIALAREIEGRDGGLRSGALYPALRVLEHEGLIARSWNAENGEPARKVYRVTTAGKNALSHSLKRASYAAAPLATG